uniref:uncharacterized protein n=1 Tax=Myxine glutinosa TaxID=7769 RepID=UPI00358F218C
MMGARERVENSLMQVESSQHFLSRKDILATWNDILKAKFIPCHVENLLQEQRPATIETRQKVQSSAQMLRTQEDGSSRNPEIPYSRTIKEQEKSVDVRRRPNGVSKHHTVARCQDIWSDVDRTRLEELQLMSEQDRSKSVRHRRHTMTSTCKDSASPETGEARVQYLNEKMGLHPTGHAEMSCNGFVSNMCCVLGKCAQPLTVGKEGKCSMHNLGGESGHNSHTNMTPQLHFEHPSVPFSKPAEDFQLLDCNGAPQHKVGSGDESSTLHVQDTCRNKRPFRLSKLQASQSRAHLWNEDSFACQRDIAPTHKALQPKKKSRGVVDHSSYGSCYHEQDHRSNTHLNKMETTQDLNCKGIGVKSPLVPGVSPLSERSADPVYEVSAMDYCGLPTNLLNILDDLQLEPFTNGSCSPLSSKSQANPVALCSKELEMETLHPQQCAQRATDKDSARQLLRSCPESMFVEATGTLNGHLPGSALVGPCSQHGIQLRRNGTGTPQRIVSHASSQISDSKLKLEAQGAGSARRPSRDCCGGEEDRIETVRATATDLARRLQVEANNLKKARASMERFVKSDEKTKENEIAVACVGENYKGRLWTGPRSRCSDGLMRTICQENSKKHCHKEKMDSERESRGPRNEGRKRACYRHARDGVERSVERLRARKWKQNLHEFSSSLDCSDESSISLPVSNTASPCTESNRGFEFEESSALFCSQKPCSSAECSPCSSKSHQLFRNHTQDSMDSYLAQSCSFKPQHRVFQEQVFKASSDCASSSPTTSSLSSISPPLLLQGQPDHFGGGENPCLQEHKVVGDGGKAEPPESQARSRRHRSGKHISRKSKRCSTCMATGCVLGAVSANPACVSLDQDSRQSHYAECVHHRGRECLREDSSSRLLHKSPLSTDGDGGERLLEVPLEERTASSDTSVGSDVDGVALLLERIRALQYNLEESYLQQREQQLKRRRHRV